jgi:hypothetical protein
MGECDYRVPLAHNAELVVRFQTDRNGVTTYRVVLVAIAEDWQHTVRVWDNVHGPNDVHRYIKGVKQPAENFSSSTAGDAMREAIRSIFGSYREMIETWER